MATVEVPGIRGAILDRRGNALAVSEEAATIFARRTRSRIRRRRRKQLAEVLDEPEDDILEGLTAQSGFEYVAQKVDLVTADRVEKLDLEGIGILPDSRRVYPQEMDGGRLVGAVGDDGQGLFGIEQSEDDVLHGTDGEVAITKDALGQEINRDVVPAPPRPDVQLTIDGRIQAETEGPRRHRREVSRPRARPRSSWTRATARSSRWRTGRRSTQRPRDADPDRSQNSATGFTYEPGSTFKAFTVAGALEDGLVSPNDVRRAAEIQVADRTIGDARGRLPDAERRRHPQPSPPTSARS